jgi:pimeloyl-ACP methyl ester carboxylesterase
VFCEQIVRISAGVGLFVASAGAADRPVLLVVHGGPDWDHSYLREPLSQLALRHRVVLSDVRGCGRSTWGLGDTAYTPDAVVGDLLGLADALGERRFSVLGFSWGGLIAQRLAVAAPERVDRLVIASSGVLPSGAAGFEQWPERERRLAAEAAVWSDPSLSGPELTRAAAFAGAAADVWRAEALPGYLQRLAAVRFSAEWLRPWRAGTLPPAELDDPIARLGKTGIPVLLIHGRQDMRFAASAAERAALCLPRARAVVLDDAGHMTHVDEPTAWLQAIAAFLEETTRGDERS